MARNNHMNNKFLAVAEFDVTKMTLQSDDSTAGWDGSVLPVGSYSATNGKCVIPDGALMTKAYYVVHTTFSDDDATENAEIELGYTGTTDAFVLEFDIQTSDADTGIDIWDAGAHGTKVGFPNMGADGAHDSQAEHAALVAATWVKLTADKELLMTVTDDQLDAGFMTLYVEYVLTGDLS